MTLTYQSDGATIQAHSYSYRRSADQDAAAPVRHAIVVVGAGPVGLSLAIDLAQRGQRVVLLDNDHKLSVGSRAICFAKRTLEVWDRLGVGQPMVDKGVGWNVGRVFFQDRPVYAFDLLPEPGHQRPAFINLQQYYAEAYLALRATELPNLEIRWRHAVVGCTQDETGVQLEVETQAGRYTIVADHLVACDGARSPLRGLLGLESQGRIFKDRFLIADVKMAAEFPAERWFWFDPPFHPNQSVLLHRQPDGVWRIDFQLGWDADPEAEKRPEAIRPRIDAMMQAALGHPVPYELEWASVYTFACERMPRFVHGRVLFAGDAAHRVSPFGARGANSGVQDADNLGWKLDLVQRGLAPRALLDSYGTEREAAADENLLNSTRSTDFITPKSAVSRLFRDAVLDLARDHAFARRLVNSGRLSLPAVLDGSPLNTPDADGGADAFTGPLRPGAPMVDAPLDEEAAATASGDWLLRRLHGPGFTALVFEGPSDGPDTAATLDRLHAAAPAGLALHTVVLPATGLAAQRCDARPGTVYLLRPDQHVCARWRRADTAAVRAALQRALGQTPTPAGA